MLSWTIIWVMIIFQPVFEQSVSAFKYFDEALSFCCFVLGVMLQVKDGKLKIDKGNFTWLVWFSLFWIYGWLSSLFSGYRSLYISALSSFLSGKFFLLMIGCLCIFRDIKKEQIDYFLGIILRPTVIIYGVCVYLIQPVLENEYISVLEVSGKSVFLVSLIIWNWRGRKDMLYIILCMAYLIATGKAKAYGAIFIVIALAFWCNVIKKRVSLEVIATFGVMAAWLVWDKIYEYYIGGVMWGAPRAMLMKWGMVVANDRFPFGTGWGTFGSYYAVKYYSPIYIELGWNSIFDLSKDGGADLFLNDSFWPTIFTETGWIGFIFFGIMLLSIFSQMQKTWKIDKKVYLAGIIAFAYVMITTFESTAFAHSAVLQLAIVWAMTLNRSTEGGKKSSDARDMLL